MTALLLRCDDGRRVGSHGIWVLLVALEELLAPLFFVGPGVAVRALEGTYNYAENTDRRRTEEN
jgi:hypothetical protein